MKVGITILKLSPTAKASKRKGNMTAVMAEAGPERAGRDPDIDRTRSDANEYAGFKTNGIGLSYEFQAEATAYSEKLRAEGKRGLKSDAIQGFAVIVKPPMEWINGLTPEEQKRFFEDSDEIMYDIMGKDDKGRDNIRAAALHMDELAPHKHYFGMPYTADGRLCAKDVINLKLYSRFNREYPERMRQKGWQMVEDCVIYDADKTKNMTEDELAEYKAKSVARKRGKNGKTSKEYKAEKRLEGLQAAYGDLLQQGENTLAQLQKAAEGSLSASDGEILAYMKERFPEDYEYYIGQVQNVKRQKLEQQAAKLQEAQTNATKIEAETAASSERKKSAAMPASVKSKIESGEPQRSQFTSNLAYYQAKIEWGAKHLKKQSEVDDELQK